MKIINTGLRVLTSSKLKLITLLIITFFSAVVFGYLYNRINLGNIYYSILVNSNIISNNSVEETDIFIIYITDIQCEFSNNEDIISHLNEIVENAKLLSFSENFSVKFKISAINSPYRSIHLLSKFKNVDEINFGNGWKSSTMSRHLLNKGFSEKSTPQLLIVERTNIVTRHGSEVFYSGYSDEKILTHLKSMPQIMEFDLIDFMFD